MLNVESEKPILKVIDFGTSRKIIQEKYLTSKLGTVLIYSNCFIASLHCPRSI